MPLKFTHAFADPWIAFVALVLFVPSLMLLMTRVPGMLCPYQRKMATHPCVTSVIAFAVE